MLRWYRAARGYSARRISAADRRAHRSPELHAERCESVLRQHAHTVDDLDEVLRRQPVLLGGGDGFTIVHSDERNPQRAVDRRRRSRTCGAIVSARAGWAPVVFAETAVLLVKCHAILA